jgi:hypothetical protein
VDDENYGYGSKLSATTSLLFLTITVALSHGSGGEYRSSIGFASVTHEHCNGRKSPGSRSQGPATRILHIVYNSLEGLISIVAGLMAVSVSLVSFGLDSAIEVASGQRWCGGSLTT